MDSHKGKKNRLTLYIGIAMVLGIALGFVFNQTYVGNENNHIANAELQIQHMQQLMRPFEIAKDSVAFKALKEHHKKLTDQKKEAEQHKKN